MTVKKREVPFKKWTFVDKNDLDNEHWYVRLEGGKFHDVIPDHVAAPTRSRLCSNRPQDAGAEHQASSSGMSAA